MRYLILVSCLLLCAASYSAEQAAAGSIQLKPIADTYIASYYVGRRGAHHKNSEQGGNAGATKRLKIKKYENMPIFKFDFSKVPATATVTQAFLDLKLMDGRILNQVAVSSLHVDWNEGKGTFDDGENYDLNHQGACYLGPKGLQSSWRSYKDSDFFLCFNGEGGSAMSIKRAQMLDAETCRVFIGPKVIHAAREHGHSLVLCDHTGIFTGSSANIFFHSRESLGKEPQLTVQWSAQRDSVAPAFTSKASAGPGPVAGSLQLNLPHAGDDGDQGHALGYHVWIDGKQIDYVDIPRPYRSHRSAIIESLPVGKTVAIRIQAFDEAGNVQEMQLQGQTCSAFNGQLANALADQSAVGQVHKGKTFSAQIIDGMTLTNPQTGSLSPKQERMHGLQPIKRIAAVRGEFLGLQCLMTNVSQASKMHITVSDFTGDNGVIASKHVELFNQIYVKMEDNWIPDILPALQQGESFSFPSQQDLTDQKAHAIYIDVLVPKSAKAGLYSGVISVHSPNEKIDLPLEILVRDVVLPDEIAFTVEMNAYAHSRDKKVFHETYRLCHKHRLSYNVLGYSHSKPGSFTTPALNSDADDSIAAKDVKITDWSTYDAYYGPIFSGEIAKDLPRASEPASHWYLPFHDAWPYNLKKCRPDLWKGRVAPKKDEEAYTAWVQQLAENDPLFADHFDEHWHLANKVVAEQFKAHFKEKGWTKTRMQVFDNHKNYFASGSQSLWVMDEPQFGRDFEALAGIYRIQNGYLSGGAINTSMRADISRPQKMGEFMDESMDELVISSLAESYITYLRNYITTHGTMHWWYGGGSNTDNDPTSLIALFAKKWSIGCVGGMPVYTSFAGNNAWNTTDRLRVVRFDERSGLPVASFRMKAFRRAQQDMELLSMLEQRSGFNRWHLAELINKEVKLKMTTISKRPDDPGYSTFEDLDIAHFDLLREKVVASLLAQ